jgi:hypothetical protein
MDMDRDLPELPKNLPAWVQEIADKYGPAKVIAFGVPSCLCEQCEFARTDIPWLIGFADEAARFLLRLIPNIKEDCPQEYESCYECKVKERDDCLAYQGQKILTKYYGD